MTAPLIGFYYLAMSNRKKISITASAALIIAIVFNLLSCSSQKTLKQVVDSVPAKNFENYDFSVDMELIDRLNASSDMVMDYLRKYDDPNGNYSLLVLEDKERSILKEYLDLLPENYLDVFKERLLGIYVVDNFLGSGMADYVISKEGLIYTILVLNPYLFSTSLSEMLTYKENTIYKTETGDIKANIKLSGNFLGLLYILLHEGTHILDYALRISPYVEPGMAQFQEAKKNSSPFSEETWDDYDKPKPGFQASYQGRISFYSEDENVKVPRKEAKQVYEELAGLPFVSVYSYSNWAEDLAEYAAFYILTQTQGLDYSINVVENGQTMFTLRPFDNPKVRARAANLDFLN